MVMDSRRAMAYLVAPEADDYLAIMAVLEASITDLTPAEVTSALREAGTALGARTYEEALLPTLLKDLTRGAPSA